MAPANLPGGAGVTRHPAAAALRVSPRGAGRACCASGYAPPDEPGDLYQAIGDYRASLSLRMLRPIRRYRPSPVSASEFMKYLAQPIARRANIEDGCTEKFWESRVKCQRVLDEAAGLSAMAYVGLNPVGAAMARDLEGSDYTSIQLRIRDQLIGSFRQGQRVVEVEVNAPTRYPPEPGCPASRFRTASFGRHLLGELLFPKIGAQIETRHANFHDPRASRTFR